MARYMSAVFSYSSHGGRLRKQKKMRRIYERKWHEPDDSTCRTDGSPGDQHLSALMIITQLKSRLEWDQDAILDVLWNEALSDGLLALNNFAQFRAAVHLGKLKLFGGVGKELGLFSLRFGYIGVDFGISVAVCGSVSLPLFVVPVAVSMRVVSVPPLFDLFALLGQHSHVG